MLRIALRRPWLARIGTATAIGIATIGFWSPVMAAPDPRAPRPGSPPPADVPPPRRPGPRRRGPPAPDRPRPPRPVGPGPSGTPADDQHLVSGQRHCPLPGGSLAAAGRRGPLPPRHAHSAGPDQAAADPRPRGRTGGPGGRAPARSAVLTGVQNGPEQRYRAGRGPGQPRI